MNVERSVGSDAYVELEQLIHAALRWWISVGEACLGVGGDCFELSELRSAVDPILPYAAAGTCQRI